MLIFVIASIWIYCFCSLRCKSLFHSLRYWFLGFGWRQSLCTLSWWRPVSLDYLFLFLLFHCAHCLEINTSYNRLLNCFYRLTGSSSTSDTFNNPCLAHSEDFEVKEVEVWIEQLEVAVLNIWLLTSFYVKQDLKGNSVIVVF